MSVPTATVDTSVVIGAANQTDRAAVTMFERAIHGDFDIAVTTRLRSELTKSNLGAELLTYLTRLSPLGSPGRYGVSRWGGGDYWADASDAIAGNNFDGDHVAAHLRSGRAFFITRDRQQTKRARRAGAVVLTPDELLARFPPNTTAGPEGLRVE